MSAEHARDTLSDTYSEPLSFRGMYQRRYVPRNLKTESIHPGNVIHFPQQRVEAATLIFNEDNNPDDSNIIVFNKPRISPTAEPQEAIMEPAAAAFPSQGSINFDKDYVLIDSLHERLGMRPGQRLAHDSAFERARYERAKTEEERFSVRQGVIEDTQTTLGELAHSAKSTILYFINENGEVHSPGFPGETVDKVFQRGIENSRRNNFVDYQREVAEYEGWKEVIRVLSSAEIPVGSKEIVISGPGLIKGTAFTDNFVDIYTKKIDPVTGRVIIVMSRFACGSDYDEYRKIALSLDSNYFNSRKKGQPEDIFYKSHPIFINSAVDTRKESQFFDEEFTRQKGATEEERTRGYLDECRLFILHYADQICARFFNPEKIKEAFNAVVNKFNEVRRGRMRLGTKAVNAIVSVVERVRDYAVNFMDEVKYYGRKIVESAMLGCGELIGFSLGDIISSATSLVSKGIVTLIKGIGRLFGKSKYFCKRCGACGAIINCEVKPGEPCPAGCRAVRQCA